LTCPDCENLRETIRKLEEENTKLRDENTDLKRRLAQYESPHTPPSRRMYPTRSRSSYGRRFPGRPRGHPGRTRRTPRPDAVKTPERRERCEGCGAPLGEPSYVGHRVVEEISNPSPRQVIDFLTYEYKCTECGSHTTARHPDCPPEGRFGRNLLVQATLMKYEERLPFEKVSRGMGSAFGVPMTPATALDVTRRVSGWLRPEYEAVRKRIRASRVVYVDETGEKVDGVRHWLWCFTTEADTLVVIRRSRGVKVLEETLGKKFGGTLVCDGWRPYPNYTGNIQRLHQTTLGRLVDVLLMKQAQEKVRTMFSMRISKSRGELFAYLVGAMFGKRIPSPGMKSYLGVLENRYKLVIGICV